jgi:hypothetical protein
MNVLNVQYDNLYVLIQTSHYASNYES